MRSSLLVLGVGLCVSLVFFIYSIYRGVQSDVKTKVENLGRCNIILTIPPPHKLKAILRDNRFPYQEINHIKTLLPRSATIVSVWQVQKKVVGHKPMAVLVKAITADYFRITGKKAAWGRLFNSLDMTDRKSVCIMDKSFYDQMVETKLSPHPLIRINTHYFKIIGGVWDDELAKEPSFISESVLPSVYIPFDTALMRFLSVGHFGVNPDLGSTPIEKFQIIIHLKNTADVIPSSYALNRYLKLNQNIKAYDVRVPLKELFVIKQKNQIAELLLVIAGGICYCLAGVGIMNMMLAGILERRKEISLKRILGARKKDILLQILAESVMISVLGGISGLFLGMILTKSITALTGIKTLISAWFLLISLGISFLVGVLFGIYPAKRAANLDPVKVIHHS